MLKAVAKAFDVSLVRARSAVRAAGFHLAFVASVTAVKSATNALYLARRDVQHLPYLYLATALLVTAVTIAIAKRLASFSAKPILRQSLWIAAVVLAVLTLAAALDVPGSPAALYVFSEAYATALSTLFWARLGEVFDVRSGKRVFGMIAAAGMVGAVIGGLLVKLLARAVPSETWCFAAALTLVALRPLLGGERSSSVKRERVAFGAGMRYAAFTRFSRQVALLVLLLSVETAAIDFVFRSGSHRISGGDEASMAALFGVLNAAVGVLAIGFQTTVSTWMLRRMGVFAYLATIPAGCVVAGLWALVLPGVFAPLFVLKLLEMMGSFSLYQPGLQLLYNPMPGTVRGSVRAVIDGAVRKLGGALGGVVLLAGGSLLDPALQVGIVIALGAGAVIWLRLLRHSYVEALEAKLGGKAGARIPALDVADRATRAELLRALGDEDASRALAALAVLEHEHATSGFDWDPRQHLPALLSHPAEAVRLRAVDLIERAPDPSYAPFLVSLLAAPGRHPKGQAARALMVVDAERGREVLEPILQAGVGSDDEDQGLVAAVIAAFLGRGGDDALAETALLGLLERGKKAPPAERREVARLLGMLGPGPYAHRIADYLDDPSHAVRKAAIEAAGKARDERLPELLLEHLAGRALQLAARDALAAYGDPVVPLLQRVLDDRRRELSVRVQIPRILRKIGTRSAANAMLYSNIHDDAYLRYVIVEELGRMRRKSPGLGFDAERTQAAALRRLRAYMHYRPITFDLGAGPAEYGLLRRAAHDRVRQNLEAGLRLLGLLVDPATMENTLVGLTKGDRASRADAVEILDVALAKSPIRAEVLSLLEPAPSAAEGTRAVERAMQLVEGRDVQLAMIAQETLRRLGESPPDVREPTSGEPLMPKSILEKVFLLQDVQLFRGLAVDDLAAVAAITTEGHADPQQVIYEEGLPGDSMYVIISGEIHLLHNGRGLLDLNAGDSFGQTSILDGGPRPVTAKAGDEGVDFVRLERQPFMDLMTDRPELMNGLMVELGDRIRELIKLSERTALPEQAAQQIRGTESQVPVRESSRVH
jgi:CRP-like cAMP-binding protein